MAKIRSNVPHRPPRPSMEVDRSNGGYKTSKWIVGRGDRLDNSSSFEDDYSSQDSWSYVDQKQRQLQNVNRGMMMRSRGEPITRQEYRYNSGGGRGPNAGSGGMRIHRHVSNSLDSFESSDDSFSTLGYESPQRHHIPRRRERPISMPGRERIPNRRGADFRDDYDAHAAGYDHRTAVEAASNGMFIGRREPTMAVRGPLLAVDHLDGSVHEYSGSWRPLSLDSKSTGTTSMQVVGSSTASSSTGARYSKLRMRIPTWSSDAQSSIEQNRMEYRGAKPSMDLPRGYLRRKDGVVLSMGSSMGSYSAADERYINPEVAAQSLVESLESKGYKYNEVDGINPSVTSSSGLKSDKYKLDQVERDRLIQEDQQSQPTIRRTPSPNLQGRKSPLSPKDFVKESDLKLDGQGGPTGQGEDILNYIDETTNLRMQFTPQQLELLQNSKNLKQLKKMLEEQSLHGDDVVMSYLQSFEELAKSKQTSGTIGRAKVKRSDDASRSKGSKDSSSSGSVFRAKVKSLPGRGGENRSHSTQSHSLTSKSQSLSKKVQQLFDTEVAQSTQPSATLSKDMDGSGILDDTLSGSETRFDGSTISTKDQVIIGYLPAPCSPPRPMKSSIAKKPTIDESETLEKTTCRKSVGFCGEMPPPTKSGDRVPEMVNKFSLQIQPSVSDISSLPKSGLSEPSKAPFQGTTADRIERFFEQFLLTCRLAVFEPTRT